MVRIRGFTLLELIVVLILVSIVAVSVNSRFSNPDNFSVRVEQENLISALFQAQQLAMSGQAAEFSIANGSPQTYNIRVGSPLASYSVGSLSYPQTVGNSISISPSPLTLTFNGLGQPDSTPTITVSATSGGSASVCVESSGYAHGC